MMLNGKMKKTMKKGILSIMAAVAMFASCTKAELAVTPEYTFDFSVDKGVGPDTKASKSEWKHGDVIYVAFTGCHDGVLKLTCDKSSGSPKWKTSTTGTLTAARVAALEPKTLLACWVDSVKEDPTYYSSSSGVNYTGFQWTGDIPYHLYQATTYSVTDDNKITANLVLGTHSYEKVTINGISGTGWTFKCNDTSAGCIEFYSNLTMKTEKAYPSVDFNNTRASDNKYTQSLLTDEDGNLYVYGSLVDRSNFSQTTLSKATIILTHGSDTYTKTFTNVPVNKGGCVNIQGPSGANLNGWTKN